MRIVQSNRGDVLAREIGAVLRAPLADPFAKELIVVSGRPAELYLRTRLAQELGIAANIRMVSASTLLTETLSTVLDRDEKSSGEEWHCQRLTWSIITALAGLLRKPAFEPVKFYLGGADHGSARMIGLARRIAECFERYQISRPEMVAEWEKGGGAETDWQPILWRRLRDSIASPSLGDLTATAIERLRLTTATVAGLPARLAWLGHSTAAPLHLRWLSALSGAGVAVNMFVLTLSKGDLPAAAGTNGKAPRNTLVESMGQEAAAFEALFAETAPVDAVWIDLRRAPEEQDALGILQGDVFHNRARPGDSAPAALLKRGDNSLQVHSCHGGLRQVEVLHDELLRAFDEIPDLEPRDVTVLTPSIASFAPLIDAVFSRRAETGVSSTPAIPFRIVDRPRRSGNPAANVVLHVLSMVTGRVDAVSVLDLLALDPVAARFELTPNDRSKLTTWVRESGIRWGIDAEHRSNFDLPAENQNSWRFGLDRLFLGYALRGNDAVLFEGVLPYDEIEGNSAELLGRFADACEKAFVAVRELAGPRSVHDWRLAISALMDTLIDETDTDLAWPIRNVREALAEMADDAAASGHDDPVDLAALRLLFEERFSEPAIGGGYGAGSVTFGALRPGRTVPARVMVLLGMDSTDFPRKQGGSGFDLVVRDPKPGDGDPAMADRQRFLEAIMGARDRLLIVYTGRDAGSNEIVPPAVPVAELLDVIDSTFVVADFGGRASGATPGAEPRMKPRDVILHEHPLQPFSPVNFTAPASGTETRSYDGSWLEGAEQLGKQRSDEPAFLSRPLKATQAAKDRVVSLDELARWVAEPVRMLIQRRFGLTLGSDDVPIATRDPVEIDALEKHGMRAELLSVALEPASVEDAYPFMRARGHLPHGVPGRLDFDGVADEAQEIAARVQQLSPGDPGERVNIDLQLGDIRLLGREPGLRGGVQFRYQAGRVKDKQILELWVRHLALQLAGCGLNKTIIIGKPCDDGAVVELSLANNARESLTALVELFLAAQQAPIPLFPETSRAWVESFRAIGKPGDPKTRANKAAADVWTSDFRPEGKEGVDAYVCRAFGSWNPMVDDDVSRQFRELAQAIWLPLLDCLTRDKD